jgi:hypothetical protein
MDIIRTFVCSCAVFVSTVAGGTLQGTEPINTGRKSSGVFTESAPSWLQAVSTRPGSSNRGTTILGTVEDSPDQASEWDFRPLDLGLSGHTAASGCGDDTCLVPPLQKFRKGCLQGVNLVGGYLHDSGDDSIAVTSIDLSTTLAFPLGSFENLLLVTPFFRADYLDATAGLDLPAELFETGARFFWKKKLRDRLGILTIVTPAVRTDFRNSEDALRIFGLGLLTWQWKPDTLTLSGGLVHTGRGDYPILPAVGLLWTPNHDWKVDLQFPAPKISHRLTRNGDCSETWGYVSGVFGGNTWSVRTATRGDAELTLRDYRLMLGLEHVQTENRSVFAEFGLVFGRSIEFDDVEVAADLSSTWTVRCGICF